MSELITIEELKENFELLDNWENRYRYMIDMGKSLSPMEDGLKNENNRVKGCVSSLWMICGFDDSGKLYIIADSDAHITKGLIAIVMMAYVGKTADEISGVDIEGLFEELGLEQHLSPNRRSGFFSMAKIIKNKGKR